MPIQKTTAFMTSDKNTYMTLEIAQRAELLKLLTSVDGKSSVVEDQANQVLQVIFDHLGEVKDILRATGRKARGKAKSGATRRSKASAEKGAVA